MSAESEARRLFAAWQTAAAAHFARDTDATYAAEQTAHDELIDFIESHGLNYTEYDPRPDQVGE